MVDEDIKGVDGEKIKIEHSKASFYILFNVIPKNIFFTPIKPFLFFLFQQINPLKNVPLLAGFLDKNILKVGEEQVSRKYLHPWGKNKVVYSKIKGGKGHKKTG